VLFAVTEGAAVFVPVPVERNVAAIQVIAGTTTLAFVGRSGAVGRTKERGNRMTGGDYLLVGVVPWRPVLLDIIKPDRVDDSCST
jgi:hypothetical protein